METGKRDADSEVAGGGGWERPMPQVVSAEAPGQSLQIEEAGLNAGLFGSILILVCGRGKPGSNNPGPLLHKFFYLCKDRVQLVPPGFLDLWRLNSLADKILYLVYCLVELLVNGPQPV